MKRAAIILSTFVVVVFVLLLVARNMPSMGIVFASDDSNEVRNNFDVQDLKSKAGENVNFSVDRNTGKATFISSESGTLPLEGQEDVQKFATADPSSQANQFVKEYGSYFGVASPEKDLSLSKKNIDSLGMTHVRYGQNYRGIPVFGGQIIVHLGQNNSVKSANGKMVPDISIDTSANISEQEAVEKAKTLWQEQEWPENPETLRVSLYIFNKSLFQSNPDDTKNYLVWRVELYKDKPLGHEYFFIDAKTGDLIYQITGMQDAVLRHIYDCSYGDGNCYMDAFDPIFGYTYGRSEGQPVRGPQPILGLSDTDNLYDRTGNNHNYYSEKFSRDGANNGGGMGDGTLDYPTDTTVGVTLVDYYFLEGYRCPNSWFNGINSIHFCQGETTHDIVGHEYAHAVNYFSVLDGGEPSGLTYSGEPGALNENNSDVFGAAMENYSEGGSGDWLFGEDSLEGTSREMAMPSNYTYNVGAGDVPYPNKFYGSGYYCGTEDNSGVHINSSVPNHAAYLMAVGGTYNGCTIAGIGRDKEEAIFYRAQTVYYTPSTDFNEAYEDIIAACADLYGGTHSPDCINVIKALRAVEMNQPGQCSGVARVAPVCTGTSSLVSTIGIFKSSTKNFRLKDTNTASGTYTGFVYGNSTDVPISGDWDGDGYDTIGVFRPGTKKWYLKATNTAAGASTSFVYGASTDKPIVGDWNGDGIDTIGVFRPGTKKWYLKATNTAAGASTSFVYGASTDKPIVGAWKK